jgi:hypothetical protein
MDKKVADAATNGDFQRPKAGRMSSFRHEQRLLRWMAFALPFSGQLMAAPALAGPVEQLVDLAFGPGDSPSMVARYAQGGGGLVFSADRGRSWKLQCDSAFLAPGVSAVGAPVVLADGSVLIANSHGLSSGDLQGCNWHEDFSAADRTTITGLTTDPTQPNEALALVSTLTGTDSQTRLMRRDADGQWAPFGSMDDRIPFDLRVTVQAGQLRIYELAVLQLSEGAAGDGGPKIFVYKLRVSDDRAASWRESPLPSGTTQLIGIDPAHPDTLAILIGSDLAHDSILVSRDQGAKFEPYLQVGAFGGMAWAPDGRVWIGELGGQSDNGTQGLWAAPNVDTAAVRLPMADYSVQCVAYRPESDTLYACQHFWVGEVAAHTGAFSTLLSFGKIDEFVTCSGQDVAGSCEEQLCGAYCGTGHFAVAPVCGAYDRPGCGVSVARDEGADWAMNPSGPMPAAGSGGRDSGASGSSAAGAHEAVAGAAAAAPTTRLYTSSGCACGVVRRGAATGTGVWLATLCAPLLRWLRRRKPSRAGTAKQPTR